MFSSLTTFRATPRQQVLAYSTRQRSSAKTRQHGFALLITITLLAFLVLLLVSLASLTRVETQVAANSQQLATARQNALLAMNIALGQLQKFSGPDQRLTARAEITSSSSLRQPYLTGVWENVAGSSVLKTWLVSGNQGTNALAVTPANAPDPATATSANEVFLVGDASVTTPSQRVKLARETLAIPAAQLPGMASGGGDVSIGHYAFWVGDQGVKASAALGDQSDTLNYDDTRPAAQAVANAAATGSNWTSDTFAHARLRQLNQPAARLEKLFPSFTAATSAQLDNILAYHQFPLVGGTTENETRARFHDASSINYAVIVDHSVPNGALRQDFSDSPDAPATTPSAIKNFIRERATTASGLQTFHDQKQAEAATNSVFPMFSKGPVLTECAIRFQLYRNSANVLALKYEIQAEFWNPYAFTLNSSSDLSVQFANLPVVKVTIGATTYDVDLNAQGGAAYTPITVNVVNTAPNGIPAWEPGQIRVVRGGGANILSSTGAARSASANIGIVTTPAPSPAVTAPLPVGTGITVAVPALASGAPFTIQLNTKGNVLGYYRPSIAFKAANFTRTTLDVATNAGWLFGYAYDFRDDIAYWTDGSSGTPSDPPQDPRRTNLNGAFYDANFPVWSDDPVDNIGDINLVAGLFNASKRFAVFDLPAQEPTSLGALQHVIGEKPNMLGNTWGATATTGTPPNDYFDKYFFSTVPRWATWNPSAPAPLPNRYIAPFIPSSGVVPALGVSTPGVTDDSLRDRVHSAKYLFIRGAFNINSTSELAWCSVLGGTKIAAWSHGGATPSTSAIDNAQFRFSSSAQEFSTDPNDPPSATNDADFKRGVRTLSTTQVQTLATKIVQAIRARGTPFATLASFVNSGLVTQAITDSGINAGTARPYSPGWLSQADLLTSIAPFITPRSDTFLIRAYGDAVNPTTQTTEGRAWCEAVVQRTPELTAPTSGTTNNMVDTLSPNATKYPFGRQFKIIQFRWLSPKDI